MSKSTRELIAEAARRVLSDPARSKHSMRAAGLDITQRRPDANSRSKPPRTSGIWDLAERSRLLGFNNFNK